MKGLNFLSHGFRSCLLSMLLTAVSSHTYAGTLTTALKHGGASSNITLTFTPTAKSGTDEAKLSSLAEKLNQKWEAIRKSRLVFGWEVAGPRDRVPHYCVDQCGCLNREFTNLIKNQVKVKTLLVRPDRYTFNLSIRNHEGAFVTYDYHIVTLVQIDEEWFVIDPIVIGSTYPEILSVWLKRFENAASLLGYLS